MAERMIREHYCPQCCTTYTAEFDAVTHGILLRCPRCQLLMRYYSELAWECMSEQERAAIRRLMAPPIAPVAS